MSDIFTGWSGRVRAPPGLACVLLVYFPEESLEKIQYLIEWVLSAKASVEAANFKYL
jgi:hypothetical protein